MTENGTNTLKASRLSSWTLGWRRLVIGAGLVLLFVAMAYLLRAPLLSGAAHAWIRADQPIEADAIVVLGGGLDTRPIEAARLFHSGLAPLVVITDVVDLPPVLRDVMPSHVGATLTVLSNAGVPDDAIEIIGHDVDSTYAEAQAIRSWLAETNHRRINVVTDQFHTRRVRWLLDKTLEETDVTFAVVAAPVSRFDIDAWWTSEDGLIQFQNEVVKHFYYRLKY